MDNPLEQKNIIISAVEALSWGLKITDEKGLKYNVPMYKKGTENKTVAYATLEAYPQNGLNLNKCFKFVTVPNSQGGQSRYVRIITEPVQDGEQTTYKSPQMDTAKPVTIEKEQVNWDDVNFGKCKHAYLVEAFKKYLKDGEISPNVCEEKAEQWATMSMRKLDKGNDAQKVADMVGGKVVEQDDIKVEELPPF